MLKTSFYGREEEQHNHDKGDYVLTTPTYPWTSTNVLYKQKDHPTIVAPVQRPRLIKKQTQYKYRSSLLSSRNDFNF